MSWRDTIQKSSGSWRDTIKPEVQEESKASKLESFLRGGAQGVPFIGSFADEAEGAVRAVAQRIPYSEGRSQARDAFTNAQESNPKTFGTAQLAGAFVGDIPRFVGKIPTPITAGIGAAYGALEGGIYGLGASESDLTEGDFSGAVQDAGLGAGLGATMPTVFKGLGKLAKKGGDVQGAAFEKVAPRLSEKLKDIAEVQSARAQGLERATLKKLGKKKVNEIGRYGLDAVDPVSKKNIVSGFANTEDMIARNTNIQKKAGEQIGNIADEIDESGFRAFSPKDTADKVEQELGGFYRDPFNKSEANLLDNAIESIMMRGDTEISLSEAQTLKKTLAKAANWKNNVLPSEKEQLARQIYKTVTEQIDKAADEGAKFIDDAALMDQFINAKKLYGASKGSAEILKNKMAREDGNKMFGLTDTIIGAGGIGAGVTTGGLGIGATAGILGTKKIGERYGAQNMARGADGLADRVLKIPELSRKYGTVLQNAAKRGPVPLAATHYILQQQDPEYREKMRESGYDPSNSEDR